VIERGLNGLDGSKRIKKNLISNWTLVNLINYKRGLMILKNVALDLPFTKGETKRGY